MNKKAKLVIQLLMRRCVWRNRDDENIQYNLKVWIILVVTFILLTPSLLAFIIL